MKVLVTGGAGFIGSHIVEQLLTVGHEVVVLDNLSSGSKNNLPDADVPLIIKDITEDLESVFAQEKFDAVIHQAAQVSVPNSIQDPLHDLQVNVQGLLNLLETSRKHGIRKIVFASSAAVYGTPLTLPVTENHPLVPLSPYGLTKRTAEEYLRIYYDLHHIPYVILRYSNVYGPRQTAKGESGVISIFTDALCNGRNPVIFGDGTDTRDYVYVEDVARANVLALEHEKNSILNVSTQTSTDLNELYTRLVALTGQSFTQQYGKERPGDIKHSVLANQQIRTELDWNPQTELETGLRKTVEWMYSSQGKEDSHGSH